MSYLDHASNVCVPAMEYLGGACLLGGQAVAGIAVVTALGTTYAGVQLAHKILDSNQRTRYQAVQRKLGLIK